MKRLLLIGCYYPDALLPFFQEHTKSGLDFAAHNLHLAIIKGLEENQAQFDILNAPHLGSYPTNFDTIKIPSYTDNDLKSVSYCNMTYWKRRSIKNAMFPEILKWCKDNNSSDSVLLFYNFDMLPVLKDVKKKYPKIKTCLLVTDLPEYMATSTNLASKLDKIPFISSSSTVQRDCELIDGFILLAPKMCDKLPVGQKPWMQMEGIYNDTEPVEKIERDNEKVIMYTGNLGERYGIRTLLDAFAMIDDPSYRLWVRGNGEIEEDVKTRAANDSRIKYIGRLSKKELSILQKRASLMVNPVFSMQEFTGYFFPSKTLEYLASGTPTLMSPLSCMPKEYEKHIFYLNDESVDGLKIKIIEILSKDRRELDEFGRLASEFIHKEKSPKVQISRVLDFINTL